MATTYTSPTLHVQNATSSAGMNIQSTSQPKPQEDESEPRLSKTYSWIVTVIYLLAMVGNGLCYGAQGAATLSLAVQTGLVPTNATSHDVSKLTILGIVNGADGVGGIFGTLFGGWLVDRIRRWHPVLSVYVLCQGIAFVGYTFVTDLPGLIAVSMAWGLTSTMPTLATQAAMTWVWGSDVAFAMQFNNAFFGVGSVVAPSLVSWDLSTSNTFHRTYWIIGGVNVLAALLPLMVASPAKRAHDERTNPNDVDDDDDDDDNLDKEPTLNHNTIRDYGSKTSTTSTTPTTPSILPTPTPTSTTSKATRTIKPMPTATTPASTTSTPTPTTSVRVTLPSTPPPPHSHSSSRLELNTPSEVNDKTSLLPPSSSSPCVSHPLSQTPSHHHHHHPHSRSPPVVYFIFFGVYCTTESGLSNWIATFATINNIEDKDKAALLSAVFYATFTATRIIAAFVTWYIPSRRIVLVCFFCGTASVSLLIIAQLHRSSILLWCFVTIFGVFAGPMWPAMLSIVTEDYGVQLSAKHMAVVLVCAKIGMFCSQFLFSWMLAKPSCGKYFSYAYLATVATTAVLGSFIVLYSLPSRWPRLNKHKHK